MKQAQHGIISKICPVNDWELKDCLSSNCQSSDGVDWFDMLFLVHGYQSSSYDMSFLANYISFMAKDEAVVELQVYASQINNFGAEECIDALGYKLSLELRGMLKELDTARLRRISFLGHSLGGLIIRAALPRLAEFKEKFHAFVTFCSPHLGCWYGGSSTVRFGMKCWLKLCEHKAVNQMLLRDAPEVSESYIDALSGYEVRKNSQSGFGMVPKHCPVFVVSR